MMQLKISNKIAQPNPVTSEIRIRQASTGMMIFQNNVHQSFMIIAEKTHLLA